MNDDISTSPKTNTTEHQHSPIRQWQQSVGQGDLHARNQPNHGKHKWWPPRMPRTKKQWIITIAVALVVLGGGGVGAYALFHKAAPAPVAKKPTTNKVVAPHVVQPTSTLTGLPISDTSINDRPVTAVMIENSEFARPQSGIDQAGVVFEAVAEGGITRFLTLFQDQEPTYVGPVRSVRPYYIEWLMGFDAAVAHVGGSGEALQDLKDWGTKNLDQFYNPSAFHRIGSRVAPHNMYTSIPALRQIEANKGYGKANYTGFARKSEAASKTPTATSIDFTLSSALYNPHYDYDAATNSYKRSEGGKPHMVVNESGAQSQLSPKVVVGLVMPKGNNGIYSTYGTIGSGTAYVFQDGTVTQATWHKTDRSSNFTFTDANGAAVKLNPGQTWLSALGSTSAVNYK
jgi:hypothetical protein